MKLKAVSGMMLNLLLIGMLTLASNIQTLKSEPTTWTVDDDGPADFTTIQGAIDHADEGDTIFVYGGTYSEPQVTIRKPLQLIGENKSTTIIDGGGSWVCVYVDFTQNVNISGFTIRNGYGIYSHRSENVTISGNTISSNGQGIVILESTNNTIAKNIVTLNSMSIHLSGSNGNKVCENIVTLNSGDAIWLDDSHGNIISGNNVSRNGLGTALGYHVYGIRLSYSNNNTIYHNYVIDNYEQASGWESVNNIWDDGYPSGGNHWSDYNGTDLYSGPYQNITGSDGIGDTPYIVDENNQDNYPLMNPWTPTAPVITATIDINPDTLNLKSRGKWITCYIELPEGYNVGDIDRATIMLNGTIPVDQFWINKPLESVVGDYDSDTIPDLMVKFSRAAVIEYLLSQKITYGSITLTVTGEFYDGTLFEDSDMIRVKMPSNAMAKMPSEANSDNENTLVMPEFSSFLILPLFMITTLLAVIIHRRKHPIHN